MVRKHNTFTVLLGLSCYPDGRYGGKKGEEQLNQCVKHALDSGFRHIDEAEMYDTEEQCGRAISEWLDKTRTPRGELFITSKIYKSIGDGVETGCRASLSKMKTEYFDLFLIHAPFGVNLEKAWKEMEGLVKSGLVRSIGVSNFRVEDLQSILENCEIPPCCNQIEIHPNCQQHELFQYCREHSIVCSSYAGLAPLTQEKLQGGAVASVVTELAQKYGQNESQVLQQWNLQSGFCVVTTSTQLKRIPLALELFSGDGSPSFMLTPGEMSRINQVGATEPFRAYWDKQLPIPAASKAGL